MHEKLLNLKDFLVFRLGFKWDQIENLLNFCQVLLVVLGNKFEDRNVYHD